MNHNNIHKATLVTQEAYFEWHIISGSYESAVKITTMSRASGVLLLSTKIGSLNVDLNAID